MNEYGGSTPADRLRSSIGRIIETSEVSGFEATISLRRPAMDGERVYGSVWPGARRKGGIVRIREINLVAGFNETPRPLFTDGVRVAFFSEKPRTGKTYIVGYYKDARVYRLVQVLPNTSFEWNVTTLSRNATCFDPDDRWHCRGIGLWRSGMYRFYVGANRTNRGFRGALRHLSPLW
jgi:hypothetical protein